MAKNKDKGGRAAKAKDDAGCRVEAVVSVDERGQMVLPEDLRTRLGIAPGEKLALVAWEKKGRVCCLSLIRVEDLAESVKGVLGPLMKDLL